MTALTEDDLSHLHLIYYAASQLDMCGCNQPGAVWDTIQWVLTQMPLYEGTWRDVEARFTPGGAQIILGLIEHAGLIDHGGTIMGSWITAKGQWVLGKLNAAGGIDLDDAVTEAGFPHDDDCPPDCPVRQAWEWRP